MELAGKSFSNYWKIIKIPTLILIAWSVLGFITALVSFSLYSSIFNPIAGWILIFAVFGFIGWHTVKDHKGGVGTAALGGAITGVIAGLIGGIVAILMMYFVPAIIDVTVQQAMQQMQAQGQAASREQIEGWIKFGSYISIVIAPVINALLGAGIAAIGALIGKRF
ncbi:MAG: hypothetical protein GY861_07805 [bacterium]|nr:hypothetical protein [bacterium]